MKIKSNTTNRDLLDILVSIRGLRRKKMELILLPVLATVVMWRGKKSVVRVAQCVAALILVHRTLFLLSNVHRLFDPDSNDLIFIIIVWDFLKFFGKVCVYFGNLCRSQEDMTEEYWQSYAYYYYYHHGLGGSPNLLCKP